MEKLSGIIPNSRRVKSVDLDASHPVRPGAPSFGAPVGSTSSVRDRVSISGLNPSEIAKDTLTYKNPKEAARAKMVDEISQKFFDTRIKPKAPVEEPLEIESTEPQIFVLPIAIQEREYSSQTQGDESFNSAPSEENVSSPELAELVK